VAAGPGALRGLHRLAGREVRSGWRTKQGLGQQQALEELRALRDRLAQRWPGGWPGGEYGLPLSLADVQNCCCEFDKYERTRLGEGTPRQLFTPAGMGGLEEW
jgi:hypothetical protein